MRGHLSNAVACMEEGDVPRALLHATRPMVEILPRISRDLWQSDEVAAALNRSVAAIASGIRTGAKPADVRAGLTDFDAAAERAVESVVGAAHDSPPYRASVVVALLRTASAAWTEGLGRDDDRRRLVAEDAAAFVAEARAESDRLTAGSTDAEIDAGLARLEGESPPDDLEEVTAAIAARLHERFGAIVATEPGPADTAARIDQLLSHAAEAYRGGDGFRADKLVARAYIEEYPALRPALARLDPGLEAELDRLVGTELRLRIHDGLPAPELTVLVERARTVLREMAESIQA